MNNKTSDIITDIFQRIKNEESLGEIASYIPELSNVSEDKFGINITFVNGESFGVGDFQEKFSIQSIAKVLSLSLAYQHLGESIWERVDVEPSGNPFNSLIQLESDKGIPRNPFINAGALVICDILIDIFENPKAELLSFIRKIADSKTINYSYKIAESEKQIGFRNIALCNFIKSFGNIKNSPEQVLELYYLLCSIEMTCEEVSFTFGFLANKGKIIRNDNEILSLSKTKRINAIMQTCGFYDESGEFAFRVGLPGKSGVGGGIVALMPNQYVVSIWSPKLNEKGNSFRGMKFLEEFTTATNVSIF